MAEKPDKPDEPRKHPKDLLHGVTLEQVLTHLVDRYGWAALAGEIEIRCFMFDPSIGSSLKFLRKTPWARERVESMYRYSVQHPPKPRP